MASLAALMKPISVHEVIEEAPQGSVRAVPGAPPHPSAFGVAFNAL